MAVDNTTIARPYAKAVFELAQSQNVLAEWSDFLNTLAAGLTAADTKLLLEDPRLTPVQTGDVLVTALGDAATQQQRNFVRLLAENDRLAVVGEIADLYAEERAKAEQVADVTVVSAFTVTDAQQAAIQAKLAARLGANIRIETQVDESLVGGAIIKMGDQIIDGSVKGRLEKMTAALV